MQVVDSAAESTTITLKTDRRSKSPLLLSPAGTTQLAKELTPVTLFHRPAKAIAVR
jgi:hypothetical protein